MPAQKRSKAAETRHIGLRRVRSITVAAGIASTTLVGAISVTAATSFAGRTVTNSGVQGVAAPSPSAQSQGSDSLQPPTAPPASTFDNAPPIAVSGGS